MVDDILKDVKPVLKKASLLSIVTALGTVKLVNVIQLLKVLSGIEVKPAIPVTVVK